MLFKTNIVVDTSYLSWRAFHSLQGLDFEGIGTSVLFGVMRSVSDVVKRNRPGCYISWCFDVGSSKRREIDHNYKANRREDIDPDQRAFMKEVTKQIDHMRSDILPAMGFTNLLWQAGYEADDLVAASCRTNGDESIILSADQDLYQLIDPMTYVWKFKDKSYYGLNHFTKEYGVQPNQWAKVKAIAGCSSDNIKGVKGVGEKTACKYLNNQLKEESKKYKDIKASKEQCVQNLRLTKLPMPGTEYPDLDRSEPDYDKINTVLRSYGIYDYEFGV
jgi:DNA polymerase-1